MMHLDEQKLIGFRRFTDRVVAVSVISCFILVGVLLLSGVQLAFVAILAVLSFAGLTIAGCFILEAVSGIQRKGRRKRETPLVIYALLAVVLIVIVFSVWSGTRP